MDKADQENNSFERTSIFIPRGLVGLVIRFGFARDEKGANFFLVGVIFLCLLTVFLLLYSSPKLLGPKVPPVPREKITEVMKLNYYPER